MKLHVNQNNLRAFLAIELSLGLRQKLVALQHDLRDRLPKVNWVRPESIHLTLKFLGYIDADLVDPLGIAIQSIGKSQTPFSLEIQGLGVFPHIRRPRILWIGCHGDIPALLNLFSRIEGAWEPLGFPPEEKPYSPHLTLARIKHDNSQVGGVLTQSGLLEQPQHLGVLCVDRITLFRSDVRPSGAEYTALWTVAFKGAVSNSSI